MSQRSPITSTVGLPVRFGRVLARKLDPRRRESLEDSLRIRQGRWEERQERVEEKRRARSRVLGWFGDVLDLLDFGAVVFRVLAFIVRGVLRVIGGVLEGLSVFDV